MTYTSFLTRYDNELDYLLINSFLPYSAIDKDNRDTKEECDEVINRDIRPICRQCERRIESIVNGLCPMCAYDPAVIIK